MNLNKKRKEPEMKNKGFSIKEVLIVCIVLVLLVLIVSIVFYRPC